MRCPNCGNENQAGLRFCEQCATPLPVENALAEQICGRCGAQNEAGLRFCEQCAAPLDVDAVEPLAKTEPMVPPQSALTCANCGTENAAGQRFCGQCGAALDVAAAEPLLDTEPVEPLASVQVEPSLVCSNCGAENAADLRFCEQCAAPLGADIVEPLAKAELPAKTEPFVVPDGVQLKPGLVCATCGAENPAGMRFCEQCAAPLGREPIAPPVAAPAPRATRPRARRRRGLALGLAAVPLLLVLLFVAVPLLLGGRLVRTGSGSDLSDLTQAEAASMGAMVVEEMYPELEGVTPVVRQSGGPDTRTYEVTYSTSAPLEGGVYWKDVTVIIDTASDQIYVVESN